MIISRSHCNITSFLVLALSLSIMMFIAGCKVTDKVAIASPEQEELVINMQKSPCFGTCPVYSLDIYNTGRAEVYGTKNFKWLGRFEKTLTPEEYAHLIQQFEEKKFYSYDSIYTSEVADYPSVSISYKKDQQIKHTIHGKFERPEPILELQKRLEDIAQQDGWTLIEPLEADKPKEIDDKGFIKTEIIIQPRQGVHLPSWFRDNRDAYGVRIIKRIAPDVNIWLITYDTSKVTAEDMMNALHTDSSIKSAEFNKELEFRN